MKIAHQELIIINKMKLFVNNVQKSLLANVLFLFDISDGRIISIKKNYWREHINSSMIEKCTRYPNNCLGDKCI